MKIAYLSLKKFKFWYTFKNNKKYRQHKEKPQYVILEVIRDIFGNFIYLWNMIDQRKLRYSNHARRHITEMIYLLERTIHEYIAYTTRIVRKIYLLFEGWKTTSSDFQKKQNNNRWIALMPSF